MSTRKSTSAAADSASPPDTPGRRWTIRTINGITVSGHLPGWAEDDPSQTGVDPSRLPVTLADVAHRRAFDGIPLRAFTTDGGPDHPVLLDACQPEIQCHPYPDPDLPGEPCVPVVNIQIAPECWMTDLGPTELVDLAQQLHTLADRLTNEVAPALTAARADWATHADPEAEPAPEPVTEPAPEPVTEPDAGQP